MAPVAVAVVDVVVPACAVVDGAFRRARRGADISRAIDAPAADGLHVARGAVRLGRARVDDASSARVVLGRGAFAVDGDALVAADVPAHAPAAAVLVAALVARLGDAVVSLAVLPPAGNRALLIELVHVVVKDPVDAFCQQGLVNRA